MIHTDKGRKIDFKNTIIIMTSNLGAEALVTDKTDDGVVSKQAKNMVMDAVRHNFSPEFINRVDEMVCVGHGCLTLVYKAN